jgi:hypothetical protein
VTASAAAWPIAWRCTTVRRAAASGRERSLPAAATADHWRSALRCDAPPARPSARGRHRRRLPAGPARPPRAAGCSPPAARRRSRRLKPVAGQTAHLRRLGPAHRTGPPLRDRVPQAAGVSRCPCRRRPHHSHLLRDAET